MNKKIHHKVPSLPVYNEQENIHIHRRVAKHWQKYGHPFEIIFTNDGSHG